MVGTSDQSPSPLLLFPPPLCSSSLFSLIQVVARCAMSTTMGACFGGCTALLVMLGYSKFRTGRAVWDLPTSANGALTGMVVSANLPLPPPFPTTGGSFTPCHPFSLHHSPATSFLPCPFVTFSVAYANPPPPSPPLSQNPNPLGSPSLCTQLAPPSHPMFVSSFGKSPTPPLLPEGGGGGGAHPCCCASLPDLLAPNEHVLSLVSATPL